MLPEIFASAYEEKGEAKSQPIKIWGVTIDPNGKPDAKVSVVLMKWLRARCVYAPIPFPFDPLTYLVVFILPAPMINTVSLQESEPG